MTSINDPLARLEAGGFPMAQLTSEEREVLSGLTPDQLGLLLDIKARLDEAGPEVRAHSDIAGGALF
jgi:hypothetical protein